MNNSSEVIISIDAGTSIIKTVAFDLEGKLLASTTRTNDYSILEHGCVIQDMDKTWDKTIQCLRDLLEIIDHKNIIAFSVTGQGDGTWLIDNDGKSTHPALLWLDSRSSNIVNKLRKDPNDVERYNINMTGLMSCHQGPQLIWFKENNKEILQRSVKALHCKDWIYYNLTGEIVTDPSEAIVSYGDLEKRYYSDEVIEILGLTSQKYLLPEISNGLYESHPLKKEISKDFNVKIGTPVILGYVDGICTQVGVGMSKNDKENCSSIVGSTGAHAIIRKSLNEVKLNSQRTGFCHVYPEGFKIVQTQAHMSATLNIDWLFQIASDLFDRNGINVDKNEFLKDIDQHILEIPPSNIIFHPFISSAGERCPFINSDARASFVGLNSQHGYFDLMRSVFEGLAMAAKHCFLSIGSIGSTVILSGGVSKNESFCKIYSTALNKKVKPAFYSEAGAAGAAMIAAVNLGVFSDLKSCSQKWIQDNHISVYKPDPDFRGYYDKLYENYLESLKKIEPLWGKIK